MESGWKAVDVTPGYYYNVATLQKMVNTPEQITKPYKPFRLIGIPYINRHAPNNPDIINFDNFLHIFCNIKGFHYLWLIILQ